MEYISLEDLPEQSPQSQNLMKICRLSFLVVDEALYKAPAADEHFQELAKDIHESNKNISNPYEHEDTDQYNWAFDSLLSDEKKNLIAKTKRLIKLIKAGDPPKNYVIRKKSEQATR